MKKETKSMLCLIFSTVFMMSLIFNAYMSIDRWGWIMAIVCYMPVLCKSVRRYCLIADRYGDEE